METLAKISNLLFNWVLDRGPDSGYEYLSNTGNGKHGLIIALIILVVVSLLAAYIYYYIISKRVSNATKKNYISVCIMGLIGMILINYLLIYSLTGFPNIFISFNMIKLNVIDLIYFLIAFEIWSWVIKSKSNARNISLILIIKDIL